VDLSDEELVRLSQQGDLKAFDILVERYQKKVFTVAYGLIHDADEAKDLTQESFIRAYSALGDFRGAARFYTWIYRIAVNLCKDHFRKQSMERAAIATEQNEHPDPITPDRVASQHEVSQAVRQAIRALPDDHRTVIILREIEGLTYQEIAQVTGISIGTVMSRLFYARRKLREILKPYFHGEDHE
jgi:RNA polymerase sigma-70 factor (ECF subfamily)